jgi:hypothetical protein
MLASSPETEPRQKRDLLVELAELLRLSGDSENAAKVWREAAEAVPGERDDGALLESAACLMAIGEWDAAASLAQLVLLTSRAAPEVILRAKYLAAQIEALARGGTTALEFYLTEPEYVHFKPSIYYTLYIITRSEEYKSRLITEYPASPETRLLTDTSSPFPGAMWLLYPGREGMTKP